MSRLSEYAKPLWQFIQTSPVVFWSTVGLAALVVILFVSLPARHPDNQANSRETAEALSPPGAGAETSEAPTTAARARPVDRDRPRADGGTATPTRNDEPGRMAALTQASKRGPQDSSPETSGGYTVQVGSFASEEAARQVSSKLEAGGYPAFVKAARVRGRGLTYRVRVGRFATRKEAQLFGDKLVAEEESIKSVFATIND